MHAHPPDRSQPLAEWAPEVASTVVRVAGDIALVVGEDGVIRTVAEGSVPLHQGDQAWVGRPWADTVGDAARQKVELLLQEAQRHGVSQRRELNHRTAGGDDIPVSWAAVRLGERGPVLAVGRDLRAVSAIQQRFMDAQQELEREYWLRRQTENRYRQLFQVAHDAVLVLEAGSFRVLEANPAAAALLGCEASALVGNGLHACIEAASHPALDELLVTARATGRAAEMRLRVSGGEAREAGSGAPIDLSATPFRADDSHCLLLRARRADASTSEPQAVLDFIGQTPDGVVVTDSAGRVLWANPSFAELCHQGVGEARLRGLGLADALGGDTLQWATLLARVRARGIVGQASVTLRPAGSPALLASVSAALLAEGDQEHIGFTLRLGAASAPPVGDTAELTLDMNGLAAQLGRLTLQQMLDEASRLSELHFIQAALRGAGGHLDGAAALLRVTQPVLLQRMHALGLQATAPAGAAGDAEWLS